MKGECNVPENLIGTILDNTDSGRKWLLTGEDEKLKGSVAQMFVPSYVGVPHLSQYAYAGYLREYAVPEYINQLPIIDFTPDR